MDNEIIPKGDINCQVDLVKAHLTRLRALHPTNPLVLVCEANSEYRAIYTIFVGILFFSLPVSWVGASHMAHLCAPFTITPMRDLKSGNIGVITTGRPDPSLAPTLILTLTLLAAETKENGVLLFQTILSNRILNRSDKVFSVGTTAWKTGENRSDSERFEDRIGELHSQVSRFRKVIKTAADAFGLEKITYSGKDGVHQDDLVMVMLIAVYFIQKSINSS